MCIRDRCCTRCVTVLILFAFCSLLFYFCSLSVRFPSSPSCSGVTIDDFGTEYANLALLSAVEFDVLKLDKSMVDDVVSNPKAQAIVSSIVDMGQKMGIQIVAEGIETEEQLEVLRTCGVELAQGFLFSKPISVDEYEKRYLDK